MRAQAAAAAAAAAAAPGRRHWSGWALLPVIVLLHAPSLPAAARKKTQVRGVAATLAAADTLTKKGRLNDAIRAIETVLTHAPGNIEALGRYAAVLPEIGRHDDATAALEALLRTAPDSPAARLFLLLQRRADGNSMGDLEALAVWQRAQRAQHKAASLSPTAARIYHGVDKRTLRAMIPASASADTLDGRADPPEPDGLALFEEQLSESACQRIVELFESSSDEHFAGNTIQGGVVVVDAAKKQTVELDVKASQQPEWDAVDDELAQVLVHVVAQYEMDYPGVSFLPNPLWDEGFRVKRYTPARQAEHQQQEQRQQQQEQQQHEHGGGFHHWHVDSGGDSCRELAVLFFLNDVPAGGETVFLTPRKRAIHPRRGAVLVFPASHTHVHAGAPPVGGAKYVVSNFVASCDASARLSTDTTQQE